MARLGAQPPASFARAARARGRITIRRAGPGDGASLRRLAALADRPAPTGEVLLAEVDGEPVAALALDRGDVLTDPFRPVGDLAALLRLRAGQLDDAA